MATTFTSPKPGEITYREIKQQFELWPKSVLDTMAWSQSMGQIGSRPLFTGAGSSAYAASAIAASYPGALSIPTTDLLVNPALCGPDRDCLISIARSGDSPESAGVVRLFLNHQGLRQFAITCNASGTLAKEPGLSALLLDPRTNDDALAMTSSFSNLVLAGMSLKHAQPLLATSERLHAQARRLGSKLEAHARQAARLAPARSLVLGSAGLYPLAKEAALKITELTCGRITALPETFLGLRHGPMSYLRHDSLVLCYLSSDPHTRLYELDVIKELRQKGLGRILCVAAPDWVYDGEPVIEALAPELPDILRTPFEVVFAQLLAFYLSEACGLNPDFPSPDGVIHRIVQGVRLHER